VLAVLFGAGTIAARPRHHRTAMSVNSSREESVRDQGAQSAKADGQIAAAAKRGDELFGKQQWSAARAAYDRVLIESKDWSRPAARRVLEHDVQCSLRLGEFAAALRQVVAFRTKLSPPDPSEESYDPHGDLDAWQAEIAKADFFRRLLEQVAGATPPTADEQVRHDLAQARVEVDLQLCALLDPDSIHKQRHWGWDTGYAEMRWWWRDDKIDKTKSDDDQDGRELSVPVASNGRPAFLRPPATYSTDLGRASKLLYLLDEIERLDATALRNGAARAMLHRADLARRLYGPGTDRHWQQEIFHYAMRGRASFSPHSHRDLKELWQLDDDEARTVVDNRPHVITLPASESPLALWSRVEKLCPRTKAAAEAIYQRGLYFQNRRQFAKALVEYQRLIAQFPADEHWTAAKQQMALIEHSDILLGKTGIYPEGSQPKLWFASRNATKAQFTLRRFDLKQAVAKQSGGRGRWDAVENLGDFLFPERFGAFGADDEKEPSRASPEFTGALVASWTESLSRSDQPVVHTTHVPFTQPGTYLVEARLPGGLDPSRGLIIIADAAIVAKPLSGKILYWVVHPGTGQPLVGRKLEIHSSSFANHQIVVEQPAVLATDEQGIVEWTPPKPMQAFAVLDTPGGGILTTQTLDAGPSQFVQATSHAFGVTDRPLYRPGSTVQFRLWLRELVDRAYRPAKPGVKRRVELQGPSDSQQALASVELVTDQSGSLTGTFKLDPEASLGAYSLSCEGFDARSSRSICDFRVEDYKKTEFEVTVTPARKAFRLGETIQAKIQARYYFGGPVGGAALHYTVYRGEFHARFAQPREWDWLYGDGFGDYTYSYPWIGDRDMQDEPTDDADEDADDDDRHLEKVADQTTHLAADGSAEIRIDTSSETAHGDYRYRIDVEVGDESRRQVEASETVIATRRQLDAFAELDRGWYEPGSEAAVDINLRSLFDAPLGVGGKLTLYRIKSPSGGAPSPTRHVDQDVAETWNVRIGTNGHLQFHFRVPSEGQYRLAFETQSTGDQAARASVNFWVYGPKLDGRQQRFGPLEVIPDRRWYKAGDTARLLINTSQAPARLLVRDLFDRHWFVDVPAHTRVIEVPILEKYVPNYFVEATLVADGAIYTEKCELYVPPLRDVVKLDINADRPIYKPGEKGQVRVRATDWWGKPVSGPLTLTAYDKSLTYISGEEAEGPRSLLLARRAYFNSSPAKATLGARSFSVSGKFVCPEFHMDDGEKPPTGAMGGGMGSEKDPSLADNTVQGRARRRGEKKDSEPEARRARAKPFEPAVRSNFSDTAAWLPNLALDGSGTATADITFPDSLTAWRIRGYVITNDTRVGDATSEVTTVKPLLVRLQAPRFAVEGDDLTLSANVHNDLPSPKDVTAELIVPAARFESSEKTRPTVPSADGNLHLIAKAPIGSRGQRRFDWPLKVRSAGPAPITVKAVSDNDGDAMRVEMPLRERGAFSTQSRAGSVPADDLTVQSFPFELPPQIDPARTRIDISLSPSPCGAVLDAIPYLAGYPYGCVEQTMSRFYPTVLAADTLKKLGIDLETLTKGTLHQPTTRLSRFTHALAYDSAELQRMTAAGLTRLHDLQHADGGWGWWQHDASTSYMTAYVLLGLATAADSGVAIDQESYSRALDYLYENLRQSRTPIKLERDSGHLHELALVAYVLSLPRSKLTEKHNPTNAFFEKDGHSLRSLFEKLIEDRGQLTAYGRALLALGLHNRGEGERARALLLEILGGVRVDQAKGTASVGESDRFGLWHWYAGDVETNACLLRAIMALDPQNPLAAKLANWLAANRRQGECWDSTRDTALAVHALSEYLLVAARTSNEFTVAVALDGRHVADVPVDWKRMLAGQCRVEFGGSKLKPGAHRVTLTRTEHRPLYYSLSVHHFDRAEAIAEQGTGIHVSRRYYKLPAGDTKTAPAHRSDQATAHRLLLKDRDLLHVGDTVEVELTIRSDESRDFIAFEDPKPAGFEPTELQSGYAWGGDLCSNVELRDEDVVFFSGVLPRGTHVLSYKLRSEVPGTFHARPTRAFDMYHPQITAHSDEVRLQIHD
jgi:alpha-2-macroglobulin